MFHCQVRFKSPGSNQAESLVQELWSYAAGLYHQGCVAYDYWITRLGRSASLHCQIPERYALHPRFQDAIGKAALRRLRQFCLRPPEVRILGVLSETPDSCRCQAPPALHLFTTFADTSSPLACGGCRKPVPLYRLARLERSLKEGLLRWQRDYQSCDELFIASGFAEMWAYRQMSRSDSGLTLAGRELCAQVEAKVRTPVFYYLLRYWGRSAKAEAKRRCPGCGGDWLLLKPRGLFDFKCARCRLLSQQAPDFWPPSARPKPPPPSSSKARS